MNAWVSSAIRRIVSASTYSTVAMRSGIGLAQRPGRLRVDVAVGRADHLEDRLQRAAQRLDRHLGAHPSEQGRRSLEQRAIVAASGRPAAGTRASQLRWIIESTRCTRLP